MTHYDWLQITLAAAGVLLIPAIVILLRGAVKWTRTEDRLAELVTDMRELMVDKDKIHAEMLEQMRLDRDATDKRLRYLEEFFMDRGRSLRR
jgi:hypothetical protein